MKPFRTALAAAASASLAASAIAQPGTEAPPLALQDAIALAGGDQPALLAFERDAQATEQSAAVARTLPDPELTAAIENFPVVRGKNAFSPVDDEMTMYTIGVMREQVRRSKREADAQRILAEALLSRLKGDAEGRRIRRDVMLAWIDAVSARARQQLLERLIADLRAGRKVIEAGIPTGTASPPLALQTDAEIALQMAQLADAQRAEREARADLARWIGGAASRPLPDAIPRIELSDRLPASAPSPMAHPVLQVALAEQKVAERQIEVAQQARKPDLSWSVSVGFRPRYGEMVSAGVSLPFPINRKRRQDRLVTEAQIRADAARLRLEDSRRQLDRDYRAALATYDGADAEIARIDREAVPALEAAFSSAEARYAAGGGTLDQPFAIVRRYVEVAMMSLDARSRRARAAAEILYFLGEVGQ